MRRGSICKGRCSNCSLPCLGQHSLASFADAGSDRFSDLSQAKRRPALVAAKLQGDDLILCQITSQAKSDNYAIAVTNADFISGGLNLNSNIRPNRLFTADKAIVLYTAGQLKVNKMKKVTNKIIDILN